MAGRNQGRNRFIKAEMTTERIEWRMKVIVVTRGRLQPDGNKVTNESFTCFLDFLEAGFI